jgi:light-regulated signal transduction histidine kinase (bacteriophytochrome)
MPHGHCFLWQPNILWLHVLSDAGIAIAYYAIPLTLLYFVRHSKNLPFKHLFLLFATFIVLCGTTHVMSIWVLWHPDYALEGVIKAMTAVASIGTFFVTVRLIPLALKLITPEGLDMAQLALKLQKSEEALRQYTHDLEHIASHDLKEPLRGMSMKAAFLLEDYKDKLDDKGVEHLKRLVYLSVRMEQLIRDLLYFSQLGRAHLAIQDSDPNQMIEEIRFMIEPMLKERNVQIIVPQPLPHIVCDKVRITEVFRNLITNAIKYNNKPEKLVEVGFMNSVETSEGWQRNVFYVKDNGIGIAPEYHRDIFRIFKKIKEMGDDKDGTGVGLTFVKKIIERYGGRIWLESRPQEGTTFYFTLENHI